MKYIKTFEKAEILYRQVSDKEYLDYYHSHNMENLNEDENNYIINLCDIKNIIIRRKEDCYINLYPPSIDIDKFSDDWFLVGKLKHGKTIPYICDTFEGVKQLLNFLYKK